MRVQLRPGQTYESPLLRLTDESGKVRVRLSARQCRVRPTLLVTVAGVEYRCTGRVTDQPLYELAYTLPVVLADHAWEYLKGRPKDALGRAFGVPLTRLTEFGHATARLLLEHLDGDPLDTAVQFFALDLPRSLGMHKNSVAFDATTSATETSGDGILSLTHTCAGSDRAAFMATTSNNGLGQNLTTSITYAGSGGTQLWDIVSGIISGSGYRIVNPTTGAQTVTATLAASTTEQVLGVVSMTGVDQSTPVGTPATATGNSTTPSATVSSPATDSLICDAIATDGFGTLTVGANQTERWNRELAFIGSENGGSTQSGVNGGVMSWTATAGNWLIGAVEFKAVAVGGGGGISSPFFFRRSRANAG